MVKENPLLQTEIMQPNPTRHQEERTRGPRRADVSTEIKCKLLRQAVGEARNRWRGLMDDNELKRRGRRGERERKG